MLDPVSAAMRAIDAGPAAGADVAPLRAPRAAASAEGAPDFGSVLGQLMAGVADTLKAGEATALAGIQGQASTQQVVEAVMTAEQTLQTAIAIRDKVVTAFLELGRMQI